ncbi:MULTISPECIES: VanZ family protein [Clostridium]|jgi:VanZ family protein|uniref:VanZ family protein n=1 Tax=Clostridium TaxID=1485 RepID=UPI001E0F01D3|nr:MULTISPECIES: VanZ family protein [Clostridium]MBS5308786.1 VanZ family protein [Clostridium sp.]MBS6503807.1 VanZ family protein [Clostridium sp.]MDB1946147.1 VanZ family protein [Clostridium tertium]MDB1953247.1 VanZ family protein [Clostridium tertium]MDU1280457.1 VanZ family protein [Clostridium sp.]
MNKNKKMISWIMLIAWMGIIFFMSHQPGEVSSSQSELVLKIFSFLGIELNQYFGELATLVIRKTAHFSEYLILFLFAYNVSRFYFTTKKARLYSIIFVFLYASTDEFHQYFIPGRNMAFKDVLIDTSGGVIGYLIMKIVEIVKLNK